VSDAGLPVSPACGAATLETARILAGIQIAQTMALAVQDAADHLRDVETIAATAQGTALRRILESGASDGAELLAAIQLMMSQGQDNLERVGNLARVVLDGMR